MDVVRSSARNVAIDGFSGIDVRVMRVLNKGDKTNITPFSQLLDDGTVGKLLRYIGASLLELDQVVISDCSGRLAASGAKVIFCPAFGLLRRVGTTAGNAAAIIKRRVPDSLKG